MLTHSSCFFPTTFINKRLLNIKNPQGKKTKFKGVLHKRTSTFAIGLFGRSWPIVDYCICSLLNTVLCTYFQCNIQSKWLLMSRTSPSHMHPQCCSCRGEMTFRVVKHVPDGVHVLVASGCGVESQHSWCQYVHDVHTF